jgi:hypothetical protein
MSGKSRYKAPRGGKGKRNPLFNPAFRGGGPPWTTPPGRQLPFGSPGGAPGTIRSLLLPPPSARIPIPVAGVLIGLAVTGWVAARLGGVKPLRPVLRVMVGGALAMAITFGIGNLVGATVG